MTKFKFMLLAGALVAPAVAASPAAAQVAGIATSESAVLTIAKSKAYGAANTAIGTQYKAQLDQIQAKQQQLQTVLARLDKNGDKQVDNNELAQARTAKSPDLTQAETIQRDIATQNQPLAKAQAYAVEQILTQYTAAQRKVVADRKINIVVAPDAIVYAPPAVDVSAAILQALDAAAPTVQTAAPANWNPNGDTVEVLQGLQRLNELRAQQEAYRAAAAQQRPAAGAAPATTAPAQPARGAPTR
ncbi:OmpH family outer membrane protein [Sphingomonas aracearum]|uniref:OmpH family outer membrane protein n=1 Tax=Sphingomonas aracearum TaxID=2283317 RepID=A0A369VV72_9SPHN|nr:OmpH family outer membrane protein [Sphingomonas aracearum]RDE05070.1 OmpH family outer membrane protein [Sphingomonas aracearum]